MNPDYAIVLNFNISGEAEPDFDFLVKTARNIGARAVSGDDRLKAACEKYTIFLTDEAGQDITSDQIIETMVNNRKMGKQTVINIPVHNGKFSDDTKKTLDTINSWMHMFGHAFNDGQESDLTIDQDGFVLENRHAHYQKYVLIKSPLPEKIVVSGLDKEPNRVEWIQSRIDLDFHFEDGKLAINLTKPESDFAWQVLRIQAHRHEDDLLETEF